jgi:hypothetical protein
MYVFSKDIPFKGSLSRSNMRSKATAVSYLHSSDVVSHSGVIDTTVQVYVTAVSMTPLFPVQPSQISAYKTGSDNLIFDKVGCTAV